MRVVITGGAGLVGQNLAALLGSRSDLDIVAIDKHEANLKILAGLQPSIRTVLADLSEPGDWSRSFESDCVVVLAHAQITSRDAEPFVRNNVVATQRVLEVADRARASRIVHLSSSVVNSVVVDDYTRTKRRQEELVQEAAIDTCILRPTLMFGWFDPKHLGWLARFMKRTPVFPIPGSGRYTRQPLYVRDVCRVIEVCLTRRSGDETFDLAGIETIAYADMIRLIRDIEGSSTRIVRIPVAVFAGFLRVYARFTPNPPFTADQLIALTAGDHFVGVDIQATFGVEPTPFAIAMKETLCDPRYSSIVLGGSG